MHTAVPGRGFVPACALLACGVGALAVGGGAVDRFSLVIRALGALVVCAAIVVLPKDERSDAEADGSSRMWGSGGLVAVLIFATAVRVYVAATETMHYDEAFTFTRYADASLGHILTTYDAPNNHILHSLLVKASTELFGTAELFVRLPALAGGVAIVWLSAAVAAQLAPAASARRAALVAAALAAGFPPFVTYSANARGYSLAAAGGLLILLAALHLATGDRRRRWLLALLVGSAGALLVVPVAVMVVAGGWLWLAGVLTVRRAWTSALLLRVAIVGAGVVALAASVYVPIRDQPGFRYDGLPARSIGDVVDLVATAWTTGWGTVGVLAVVALAALATAYAGERAVERRMLLGYLVALVGVIAVAGTVPPFARTYLALAAIVLPAAAVGAVFLVGRLQEGTAQTAVVVALVGVLTLTPVWGLSRGAWDEDPRRVEDFDAVVALQRAHPSAPVLVPWLIEPTWSFYVRTHGDPRIAVAGGAAVGIPGAPASLLVPLTGDEWREIVTFAGGDPATFRVLHRWPYATEIGPAGQAADSDPAARTGQTKR